MRNAQYPSRITLSTSTFCKVVRQKISSPGINRSVGQGDKGDFKVIAGLITFCDESYGQCFMERDKADD